MKENNNTYLQYYGYSYLGFGHTKSIFEEERFEVGNREFVEESKLPEYVVAYNFLDIKDNKKINPSKTYVLGKEISVNNIPEDFYNDTNKVKEKYRRRGIEKIIHLRGNHHETHKELDRIFDNNWELINCEIKK